VLARKGHALSRSLRYLLDNDWIIDVLVGRVPAAREALDRLSDQGLAVSIITVGELYDGAFGYPDTARRLASFRAFLAPFPIVDLNEPIMELFARERARLRQAGMLVPDFDLLIAATALHYDLTLLTRNVRHFTPSRFPALQVYGQAHA
jgi:predicted nucleic acid-binding protein